MAIVKLCAEQLNTLNPTYAATVTCDSPAHTPVGAGDNCFISVYNVELDTASSPMTLSFSFNCSFEYEFIDHGVTFCDYCEVYGLSGSASLPSELRLCNCGLTPTYEYSYSCNAGAITTTSTMVQCPINLAFTVSNLCTPTVFCVSTVACP